MINIHEVLETNNMIQHDNLDVRTITMAGKSTMQSKTGRAEKFNQKYGFKSNTDAEKAA